MNPRPPGFLRPTVNPDIVMMICTAGHVDHGKTSLVKLLTGCNTARLKEEQERGLTIELGFAPCLLQGDVAVGVVDVPGHEKFVRNMVAGVSGIGLAVLVVAADDGIMPQTLEHFQILDLLGVRNGLVALTKIDLVSPERVAEVTAETRSFLAGTFMESSPICPVSSVTLEGISEFHSTLVECVRGIAQRRSRGIFRMPVVNAFVREGFGHVITGIPVDGSITLRTEVELVPGGARGRVRGIQRFLRETEAGGYGQCLALNIPDLGKTPAVRGQVLCLPGYLGCHTSFHLRLRAVPGIDPPLRNAEQVKFHTGTCEQPGKLFLLDEHTFGGGVQGLATIVLQEPVAAAVHDRFIIRRPSPAITVAGGEILAVGDSVSRPRKKEVRESLHAYLALLGNVDIASPEGIDRRIERFLHSVRPAGATLLEVSKGTLIVPETAGESLARLTSNGTLLEVARDHFVHTAVYRRYVEDVARRVRAAASEGRALSVTLGDLRKGFDWPQALWNRIQEDLEREGLITRRGGKAVLETAVQKLSEPELRLMERILGVFEQGGFNSPRPDELPERLQAPPAEVARLLDYLCQEEKLFRLTPKVVLSRGSMKRAQDIVVRLIKENGILNSADLKYHLESTRKYALAVLDHLDLRKVTVRIGNDRKLAANYERYLI
ncbi:MAG: selenocysteine-specific translation elongation factor [Planctomycetota bacterium]